MSSYTGLTANEVAELKRNKKANVLSRKYKQTYLGILFKNIVTFFNIVLAIVAVLLALNGAQVGEFAFLAIGGANTLIGIIQQIKAKRITDKLNLISSAKIKIIRDGEIGEYLPSEIVEGDVILLEAGNQIPIDAELLEGYIEVDESLLTGESIAVKKSIELESVKLIGGTNIISGSCYAKAVHVGNDTYAAKLQKSAKNVSAPKSEILKVLNRVIKIIVGIAIPLAILMFVSKYINIDSTHSTVQNIIKETSASIVGMLPAGMLLLTSVALAVAVIRLAGKKVLVQQMYSIEMLARTDVICLDKTGTLTDGTMIVDEVLEFEADVDLKKVMGSYLKAVNDKNATAIALLDQFPINADYTPTNVLPFSSVRKYSEVEFLDYGLYQLGAPDILLSKDAIEIRKICTDRAKIGLRTLVLMHNHQPCALFILRDNIRKEVNAALKWFDSNGVEIKIISGDNTLTVAHIAKMAGVKNSQKSISLLGMTDDQVRAAALKYTIFGRVTPEQKAIIVDALKKKDKVVTMVGDGTNDILSMKKSDCSIAMGNGSDAAKKASDIVLLDNNFAVMDNVVAEGRRVTNNIQRSSTLFLMKCCFTIFVTFICTLISFIGIDFPYPFPTTSSIMVFECFVVGFPSFFLALQTNNQKIEGSFAKMLSAKAIPAATTLVFSVMIVMIARFIPPFKDYITSEVVDGKRIGTLIPMAIICFTFGGFVIFNHICRPFDTYRRVLFYIMFVLAIGTFCIIPILPPELRNVMGLSTFDLSSLELIHYLIIVIVCLFCAASYNTIQSICEYLFKLKDSLLTSGNIMKKRKTK